MSVLRNEKTRRVALMGLLFALSVVLSFLEGTLTPLLGLPPGVKLGLANVVVMYALFFLGAAARSRLFCSKSFLLLLHPPGAMAGALSLGGGLLSLGVMAVLCLFRSRPSVFILSVCGAITHNFGQLLVINLLMTQSVYTLYYCALCLACGLGMGADVGGAEGAFAGAGKAWFPKVSKIIDIFYQ